MKDLVVASREVVEVVRRVCEKDYEKKKLKLHEGKRRMFMFERVSGLVCNLILLPERAMN